MKQSIAAVVGCSLALMLAGSARASDWPQFMRNPEHTGDAADEALRLPLGLATQVQLEDAILASPAVVAGRVYVVDQMGTAYCVDPKANKVIWKRSPDGDGAMGGNTSSPCVAEGRLCYGTTAGKVHILDVRDGKVLASVDVGSPVTGSLTWANKSLYFQTLGAKVLRMDLTGKVLWEYDHYATYKEDRPGDKGSHATTLAMNGPMYGGGEVAVGGDRVVVNLGWDLFCLQDKGPKAELLWCRRNPLHGYQRGSAVSGQGVYAGPAICGEWVYAGFPGCELIGDAVRLRLSDGFLDPALKAEHVLVDGWRQHWAVLSTVAVRGTTAFAQSHHSGMVAFEFGKGMKWRGYSFPETENFAASTPGIAGVALSGEHCVFTTVRGELYVAAIESSGDLGRSFKPEPFKFQTPGGRLIASAPAIVNGCVYFGSDDGCLYGLSPDGGLKAAAAARDARPRGKLPSPTGRKYPCPGPYGTQGNTNYVDDGGLKAPFRLRWAVRLGAMSRSPLSASEDDVFGLALDGTLVAVEQETGRIRWRRRLEGPGWMQSPLYHEGRLYAPRPGALYCLDASDGSTKWSARIGKAVGPYPVLCDGVVAYANIPAGTKAPVLQAYDAGTGKELWQFKFAEYTDDVTVSGCVLNGTFYFSCGAWKEPGLTVAMEPKSGKVLWENRENSCDNRTILAAADGRVFLPRFQRPLACLSAKDGSLLWSQKEWSSYRAPSVAPRLLSTRSYGGGDGVALNPETGEMLKRGQDVVRTGAPEHTCGPVFLTSSGLSLAVTVSGLHVRDLGPENKIVWSSLGFAPRVCANAIVASGRVFCNPQNGMLYCFETGGGSTGRGEVKREPGR